ncbi:hypothetical protein DSO57_1027882 [Entomophthora muscae]|uniref:Uncharacterized protein n=1 Tax=Entomophthora muscae TaxID=34485 RepID=A0ACC2SQW4_9FUNG|nr:hypothetical protein DSO57_1027882 [Entomophthora muscae]
MLILICKFVFFTLYSDLLLIWSTSPHLWGQIFSSVLRVSNNPSHLLNLVEDLPGRAQDLIISGEHLVKSLTCNDLDLSLLDLMPRPLHEEDSPSSALPVEDPKPISQPAPAPQCYSTQVPVRIDNSLSQEARAQGWDSNPKPTFLRATGPIDQGPACPRFFGIEPLQAEAPAKSQSQNTCTSSTMVAPKEKPLKLPNGSRDGAYVSFMSLKSSQVTKKLYC